MRDSEDRRTLQLQLAQGRLNRAVAASNNFRGADYVRTRDRGVAALLAILNAYSAGQANHVAALLEANLELGKQLELLDGGQVLRA